MAETAVSCRGRPASPRLRAPASRKGCHEAPAQAPGGRGCGTGTMAFAQGSCGRQTRGGPGWGTLQRDCLRSTAAPAPDLLRPQKPCVTRAKPREFSHHEPLFYISAFSPPWISEPGNSVEALAGGCSKALGNQPAGSCKLWGTLPSRVLISLVFLPLGTCISLFRRLAEDCFLTEAYNSQVMKLTPLKNSLQCLNVLARLCARHQNQHQTVFIAPKEDPAH